MSSPSENIRDYFHKLAGLIDTFDFTHQGQGESIGKRAADIVAVGIVKRSASEQRGVDGPFPDNDNSEGGYTDRKRRLYGTDLIGFRTGQMISLPSLLGHLDISPHEVLITYGTNQPPSRSMTSSYISTADQAITDTKKAEYFTEKKGRWFAIDEPIADLVREYFAGQLEIFIKELNLR